tara:strand:- start:59 stop:454 length:396 start_codon:yes stop_codon:yes gene_type:complete
MQNIYILDLERVLSESRLGQTGRQQLESQLTKAREQYASLQEQAKHAAGPAQSALRDELKTFEQKQMTELANEKEKLRAELLDLAKQVTMELKDELGFDWVLDSHHVILGPAANDLTDIVIERLNQHSAIT